jgi:hypothetical protein
MPGLQLAEQGHRRRRLRGGSLLTSAGLGLAGCRLVEEGDLLVKGGGFGFELEDAADATKPRIGGRCVRDS